MTLARTVRAFSRFRVRLPEPVGFVPTMGDLHEGHLSLVRRCKRENRSTVLSIFVNPLQFDRKDDFQKYYRNEKRDLALARLAGVDCVWAPQADEMYPEGFSTEVRVRRLSEPLCGRHRPGHFEGVCAVVLKLLNQVRPARAYFGMKDFQQYRIVDRMARDLNFTARIVPCPIVREPGGLALSSRNRRLDAEQKARAVRIYAGLRAAAGLLKAGRPIRFAEAERHFLSRLDLRASDRVEYFEAVDPDTLAPKKPLKPPVLLAGAVWIGGTRLIDNVLVP